MSKGGGGFPVTQTTYISDIPQWKKQLLGLTKDAPEYSPYKWLSNRAVNQAKMIEGMTFNPNMASMAKAYGVPEGTDLTPYIYASRTGQVKPMAPMPTNTQGTTSAIPMAKGGLMSLRKGYAKGGQPKDGFDANGNLTPAGYAFLQDKIASGGKPSKMYTDAMKKYEKANTAANQATGPAVPFTQGMDITTPYYNPADKIPDPTDPTGKRMIPNPAKGYGGVTDPMFQQGVDYLRGISTAPSQIGQASQAYQNVLGGLGGMTNYQAQNVGAQQLGDQGQFSSAAAQQYMNPYIETALKSQEDLANRQFAQQQNQLRSQAAGHGAFGGSASALAGQAAQQNQNMTMKDIVAQGMNQAYQQAEQQYSVDRARQLQAGMANQSAALQAAIQNQQGGLAANAQNLSAYGQMGNIAQGLGALGLGSWGNMQNIAQLYGGAANTAINAGKDWSTNQYISGQNWNNYNPFSNVSNLVNQQPAGSGSQATAGIPR